MPGEKNNNIFYNFFSLGIVQVITSLLQLVVIPYVIAKIGIDGFGIVSVAQVVMFYLSALTEFGFAQTATREISIHRNDRLMISAIFFRVVFSKIFLCGLAFILLLILITVVPVFRHYRLLYLSGFVFVIGQSVLINWFFTGLEEMRLMAVITLIARLIFVVLVFLFIRTEKDGVLYLFFLGLGNFVLGLISIFLVIQRYKLLFIRPGTSAIKEELIKGWQITVTNLANNICQYSNIFILRFFTDDFTTGYYSVAERVFLTLRQLVGVFSQTIYPRLCLVVSDGKEAVVSYFKKIYLPFLVLLSGGCLLLFILAPWIIYFFIHQENGHSSFLLRVFAIVLVIVCLNIPATLTLLATDERKKYFAVYALVAIVNVFMNLLLAGFFQSTGTVVTILLTELFITIGVTWQVKRLGLSGKDQIFRRAEIFKK
jgi:PST family polysaccharide transporter